MRQHIFTSESVAEGHPDKVCDQISDAVLDAVLTGDSLGRVACETAAGKELILLFGEISATAHPDYELIVRNELRRIGYDRAEAGLNGEDCTVQLSLSAQSPDIAHGIEGDQLGAGDQGLMFGYACRETEELMPLPISLAHRLMRQLAEVRRSGELPYLKPDGKGQVSVRYIDAVPVAIDTVVLSAQHNEEVSLEKLRQDLQTHVIDRVLPLELRQPEPRLFINPTGRFVEGGPAADAGLTGRKIIVDTYGGYARHGGGAFSGKDATKVDRSATYAARWVAKNLVAAGLTDRCELQVAYAIGVAEPVSLRIDTFGGANDTSLEKLVRQLVDLRPDAIIERLGLRRPIYKQTAVYGHFGRPDLDLPWERLDLGPELTRLG